MQACIFFNLFLILRKLIVCRDNSVGIATRYRLNGQVIE